MLPVHDDFHKTVAWSPLKPVAPCSDFKGQTVADQGLVNRVGKQGPTLVLRHAEPPGLLAELDGIRFLVPSPRRISAPFELVSLPIIILLVSSPVRIGFPYGIKINGAVLSPDIFACNR